jgi:hypothetical protein
MEDLAQRRVELKFALLDGEDGDLLARLRSPLSDPGFRKEDGWIQTIYLDRPDGSLARATFRRPTESLKLRIREYFTPGGAPVSPFPYVEIKERAGHASRKTRFPIHRHQVPLLLRGDGTLDGALGRHPAFERLKEIAAGPLVPMGAARYRRLAVEGGAPRARLTLDREIRFHAAPLGLYETTGTLDPEELGPPALLEPAAIAEIKYAAPRPPRWCTRAIRDLPPADYSKFLVLASLALSDSVARRPRALSAALGCE